MVKVAELARGLVSESALVNIYAVRHGEKKLLLPRWRRWARGKRAERQSVEELTDVSQKLARIGSCSSVDEVEHEATRIVSETIGYDRTMFYKFDSNGDGEVVAEELQSHAGVELRSFKGLRFPAADIPEQARLLNQRVVIRMIRKVSAVPFELVPAEIGGMPVDLTDSKFRQPSLIHVKYLKNMRVEACVTLTIVVAGKLYGMISSHNGTERAIGASKYLRLKIIAGMITETLSRLVNKEKEEVFAKFASKLQPYESTLRGEPKRVVQQVGGFLCETLKARKFMGWTCQC